MEQYSDELRKIKSLLIVTSLQKRRDIAIFERIQNMIIELDWSSRSNLLIDEKAWNYVVEEKKYDPKLIFCHPDVLICVPEVSLYYRGITGLSIKAAKSYIGAVESWERESSKIKINFNKAEKAARIYNTFICTIINGSSEWTMDNGKRTLIATLGITLDGVMRNKVGEIAEERIRSMVYEWLKANNLISTNEDIGDDLHETIRLKKELIMKFAPEPDIAFYKRSNQEEELLAVVEIKGGTDPAGALERYGAATKSFQNALKENQRCKNFLLSAVFTPELEKRIKEDRLVEKSFNIIHLLEDAEKRDQFFDELFHHTLRLI